MTDTNLVATQLAPIGGATNSGIKIGIVESGAKAAQNDTWIITNASEVLHAEVRNDSSGTVDSVTTSTNIVTLAGTVTGAATGTIYFR